MSYGYSVALIAQNKSADVRLPGVKLGRACIKRGVPVKSLATRFGVSRQTIYNWFSGVTNPTEDRLAAVTAFLASFK